MEELRLILDLTLVWTAAVAMGALFVRLKLPLIAAYIIVGILLGPSGSKLISDAAQINVLAEFGVALLLFALGVEVTLRKIFASARQTIVAGLCQLLLTSALIACYVRLNGAHTALMPAAVFGFICTLSSTAVVIKLLVDKGETETPHARVLVPILLIQDLSLIPIAALLPALQSTGPGLTDSILFALGKAAVLVGLVFIGSTTLVPRILGIVARSDSRELFTLTALAICMGVAFLSKALGVSLALGAFLGGIMISEKPYGHQVLADVIPLRDLFGSVFFVSIGLLLDPSFIQSHYLQVPLFVLFLISSKAAAAALSAYIATRSLWSAGLVGIHLAQVGEFSFVLATLSQKSGILPENLYHLFLSSAVISLILSPAIINAAPKLFSRFAFLRLHRRKESSSSTESAGAMESHLILCGYGRTGRHLGSILETFKIPFLVIDVSGEIIDELHERKIPCIFGDAFSHLVLEIANIEKADCLVVTVPDQIIAMHIIAFARSVNPKIRIIARANRADDIELLRAAGANAVVQPEFEASVEITKMALIGMERSGHEVRSALKEIRKRGYAMFKPELISQEFVDFPHEDYFGVWFHYDGPTASLKSLDTRRQTGATVLAIKRRDSLTPHPDGSLELTDGDEIYVAGNEKQLTAFEESIPVRRFSNS